MQQIINSLTAKYRLTWSEVMTEIERIFSSILSQWYRVEVMVFFRTDLQLEAVAYNSVGGVIMQRMIDFTTMRGFSTLQKNLEESLAKTALLNKPRVINITRKNCVGVKLPPSTKRIIFMLRSKYFPGKGSRRSVRKTVLVFMNEILSILLSARDVPFIYGELIPLP